MSSVLVVVVLLGMWAFVLVPLVRQRNVKADEARSVARFSSALRVLSRGHSLAARPDWGSRAQQWVLPPREGLAVARQRRLAPASLGHAAARRRKLIIGLASAVTLTLLLVLVAGPSFLVVQLLADCAFAAGILTCRWSAAQEHAAAARVRRRRDTVDLRTSLQWAQGVGHSWSDVASEVPVMTTPLHSSAAGSSVPTMTVPLDAPVQSHRAAPNLPDVATVSTQHTGGIDQRRPAARHDDAPAARLAPRVVPARPRAEPVVLAEIDLDWEPAVPEPSSCVRLVDLGGGSRSARRAPIFDESPADGVDVGGDAELEALVQRRLAASGW